MLVKRLFNWILSFFIKKQKGFNWKIVSELPEDPIEHILYLEGNVKEEDYWYALLKCPCGWRGQYNAKPNERFKSLLGSCC